MKKDNFTNEACFITTPDKMYGQSHTRREVERFFDEVVGLVKKYVLRDGGSEALIELPLNQLNSFKTDVELFGFGIQEQFGIHQSCNVHYAVWLSFKQELKEKWLLEPKLTYHPGRNKSEAYWGLTLIPLLGLNKRENNGK